MSKKKPIEIKVKKNYLVEPEFVYSAKVVRSGNGAVLNSYKKFIGKEATIIIEKQEEKKMKKKKNTEGYYDEEDQLADSTSNKGWKKV